MNFKFAEPAIHVFAGSWLQEHTDLRDKLTAHIKAEDLRAIAAELRQRIEKSNRTEPIPKLSERAILRLEQENIKRQRIEQQLQEEGIAATPEVRLRYQMCGDVSSIGNPNSNNFPCTADD